jgi:hypothetical protein
LSYGDVCDCGNSWLGVTGLTGLINERTGALAGIKHEKQELQICSINALHYFIACNNLANFIYTG